MLKPQVILLAVASVLVVALSFLPKVVVKNPSGLATQESLDNKVAQNQKDSSHTASNMPLSKVQQERINAWKQKFSKAKEEKEQVQWRDSLMTAFKAANQWDSAAFYAERLAENYPKEQNWLQAAETYFEAFSFALNAEKMKSIGQKSYDLYEKVLALNPDNLLAQTKMGVLYKNLNPQAPMKGIQMISAVIKKDPNNELALFYLGSLFMERGAFTEAIERLEKVVKLNPKNADAWIYLAQAYEANKEPEKAKESLSKVLDLEVAPEIKEEIRKKIKVNP
ncbi:MAG: tetratricopeptide repeat protein [Thermonemataceae bacterium]|nr:tetratricopeptide repeat protein [Thermonemataceae bacterium]